MTEVILDTDTISFFFRGNSEVIKKVAEYLTEYRYINISVVTYYEILNGLLYKDAKKQLQQFIKFAEYNKILPLNVEAAKKSAKLYAELRKIGKTISHNDVLIAGTAITNNLLLVTNNTEHFSRINELKIDNWNK